MVMEFLTFDDQFIAYFAADDDPALAGTGTACRLSSVIVIVKGMAPTPLARLASINAAMATP